MLEFYKSFFEEAGLRYDTKELEQVVKPHLNQNKMKKCCIFSRVSTTAQDLTAQTNELIREAERCGYSENNMIKIEFKESAIKLDANHREGIKAMKDIIETDKDVDCVFIYEISRLSRQNTMLYQLRDYFIENKIQLICLKPYMRLLDDDRKMSQTASILFSLFSSMSESEMLIKAERFQRAKNELKAQNKKFAGAVIFGYMKDENKRCVPHPVHSSIIRDMFSHYAETDDSFSGTYEFLFHKYSDYLKPLSTLKATCKVKHWMEKEIYWKGNWCYEPIVSEDVANKTIEKKKKARCVTKYKAKLDFLGRGRLKCAICGNRLIGVGGRENAYVCCTDKSHSVQIKRDVVDWILWDEARVMANFAAITDRYSEIDNMKHNIELSKKQISTLEKNIESIKAKQDKLLSVYLNGSIDDEQYSRRNSEFKASIRELKEQVNKANLNIEQYNKVLEDAQGFRKYKAVDFDLIDDFATKQEIVRKYIDHILVEKTGKGELKLSVEATMPLVRPVSVYHYVGHGHRKLIRINEDGTEDRII